MLVAHLKPRDLLLVLDNCEHLIRDVAELVAAILASCPQVMILATSREALGVAGERLHRLSSLGDEEAVALFADRAQAVNPAFRVTALTARRSKVSAAASTASRWRSNWQRRGCERFRSRTFRGVCGCAR